MRHDRADWKRIHIIILRTTHTVNYCRYRVPMVWSNTGSGDGLVIDTESLPDSMCAYGKLAPIHYKHCLSRYMDSHYNDKMVARPSYLNIGIPCTGTKAALHWIDPRDPKAHIATHFWGRHFDNHHKHENEHYILKKETNFQVVWFVPESVL